MQRPLDNNKLSKEALTFTLAHFIEGGEEGRKNFLLKGLKENFDFEQDENGKSHMTDKFLDTTLTVVDLDTYSQFKVKTDSRLPLSEADFAKSVNDFYVDIDLKTTVVKIWKIDFSGAYVSIKATNVKIEPA